MKRTAFAATLLSSAHVAFAAPVYLDCVTKFDKPAPGAASEFRFSVKVDEATGSVTHTDADGSAYNTKGFFTADKVGYKVLAPSETFVKTTSYQIDRNDLSVVRTFSTGLSEQGKEDLQNWDDSSRSIVTRGSCRTIDTKKRKF
ncbi:MAG: hypothetical protein ACXU85_00970 [Xanthobacteraceae bacterium]